MKITLTAEKLGLRPAVASVDVAASRASLAGLAWVNHYHLASESISLVLNKALELGKAPGMQSATGFPMIDLDTIPDVREVFKHDCSSRCNTPDNRTGDNVVTIPSEALFTPSEVSKMPAGTLRTFGLQATSEAKDTFNNFLHMLVTMKTVVGTHGWSGHSQVHTDCFPIGNKFNIGQSDNNMKVKSILVVKQVSRSGRITNRILGILGEVKSNLCSTLRSSEIHYTFLPIQSKGVQIVAWRAEHRLWATCLTSLLLSGNCRLHGFSSLLSGLNMQVGNKVGQGILTDTVGQAVKGIRIAIMLFPSSTADSIKRLGELSHRFIQRLSLFFRRFKKYANCFIHINIIPYNTKILQYEEVGQFLCQLKQAVPLP